MANDVLKYTTKGIKYLMRGGATILIPIVAFPVFGNIFGFTALLQCGLLLRIPLIVVWVQTLVAWTDDILRWLPNVDW